MMFSVFFRTLMFVLLLSFSFVGFSDPFPFGKIFTTPEERDALDGMKITNDFYVKNSKKESENNKKNIGLSESNAVLKLGDKTAEEFVKKGPAENNKISLSGYMVRSDGQQRVWVNGQEITSSQSLEAVVNKGSVVLTSGEKKIPLKVGQQWQEESNTVIDVYKK